MRLWNLLLQSLLLLSTLFLSALLGYPPDFTYPTGKIYSTPAGSVIYNEAIGVYFDEEGQIFSVRSNLVWSVVAPIGYPEVEVNSPIGGESGEPLSIPFLLSNRGNSRDDINLSALSKTAGLGKPVIYWDKNQNGKIDGGEPQITHFSLLPGESAPLLLKLQLPAPFSGGEVEIVATSSLDGTTTDRRVEILPPTQRGFTITDKISHSERDWGEKVTYRIDFQNIGTAPNSKTDIEADLNRDGIPEKVRGWLVIDTLSKFLVLDPTSIKFKPEGAILLFKGSEDSYWKRDLSDIEGNLTQIALYYSLSFQPDQEGFLSFSAQVQSGTPAGNLENWAKVITGNGEYFSNRTLLKVEPHYRIVADDTDDNNASTGNGTPTDPDDRMIIDSAVVGEWLEFENEVWNFSSKPQVINLQWDLNHSQNMSHGMVVKFYRLDNTQLFDSNGDGLIDVGVVPPGESFHFITKVFIPPDTPATENVIFGLRASSGENPNVFDLTYDKINSLVRYNIVVLKYKTLTPDGNVTIRTLANREVTGYELDLNGRITKVRKLYTDSEGAVVFKRSGEKFYFYTGMRDNHTYRLKIRKIDNLNYYLTPVLKKAYFDVTHIGTVNCWSWGGRRISCNRDDVAVKVDATSKKEKILTVTLYPTGILIDAVFNHPVNGACVHLYRCTDSSCNSYSEVTDQLDLYPNITSSQTNPQISGYFENVEKGDGEFQFIFKDYNTTMKGWYWVGVDYKCGESSLGNSYFPIKLLKNRIFDPNSGGFYNGEKFYIDGSNPGAILMRVLIWTRKYKGLVIKKSASVTGAFIGDFVKWTITLHNPNGKIHFYDVVVTDYLPDGVVWKAPISPNPRSISSDGKRIEWFFPIVKGGETIKISYWTYIGINATPGRKVNRVIAKGWTNRLHSAGTIVSNWGFASIRVSKGIFSDKGTIIGRVFLDDNYNRVPDGNESGVGGVRIFLDDGRFVVTDSRGKYHFDKVDPGGHALKLDETTLIKGVYTAPINPFSSSRGDMQIVEVHPGEMVKANFRLLPQMVTHTATKKFTGLKGVFRIKREIKAIFEDPKTKEGFVKNRVTIVNQSNFPLYEVTYWENSTLKPLSGTVYLNHSPYYPPKIEKNGFQFTIPLIEPKEEEILEWNSKIPKSEGKGMAQLGLQINPIGDRYKEKLNLPLMFGIPAPKEYHLVVHFPFGSAQLTPETRNSLLQLISYLRKKDYQSVVVKIEGHTDATRILSKTNLKLSKERAEAVKNFLKAHLIQISKVKIEK